MEQIDHDIIPKTLDNLSDLLDAKDKQATLETAKGTVFPLYRESKGISEGQTALALKIEYPDDEGRRKALVAGVVVGTPRDQDE